MRGCIVPETAGHMGTLLPRPRREATLGLVLYTSLAFLLFHKAWMAPAHSLIGGCCDSVAPLGLLRWTAFAITHGYNPLLTTYLTAPGVANVMWQPPAMPLLGVLTTPLELTVGPVVTYNLVVTFSLVLSGLSARVALKRWVGGTLGPLAGGLIFAFSPFLVTHAIGHPAFTSAFLVPLILLMVSELVVYQERSPVLIGAALGVLIAGQLLLSEEILAGSAICSVALLLSLGTVFPRRMAAHGRHALIGGGPRWSWQQLWPPSR